MSIDTITSTGTTESTKAVSHSHTPRLPPELWLIIFRFATSSPITYPGPSSESTSHYEPFQSRHHETTIALSDAALRDKCAITLVCRQWHALAGDMRYEDIRIGRGMAALHAALSESATTDTDTSSDSPPPSRHRVRRAVLPYAYTATPTCHAPPALALLALLPHLEVLVRPPLPPLSSPPPSLHRRTLIPITTTTTTFSLPSSPRFEFPTAAPALPALRRLEWAFDETGAAARAGGINSLTDMLKVAPNLSELVLTGRMPFLTLRQDRQPLRALHTLRLRAGASMCPLLALQISYWVMPVLENVVVEGEGRAGLFDLLWGTYGGQMRVVELVLGGTQCTQIDDLAMILHDCPALEELNVRIGVAHLDGFGNRFCAHDALQCLGICVDSGAQKWSVKTWMPLAKFVGTWKWCPALRKVVLYVRDVQVAEQDPQFPPFREELASRGRQLLLRSVRT